MEVEEIAGFLDSVPLGPAALLLEGEAGIGKTTLWQEAISRALARSYCVLSCRPGESEAQLAFAGLGDLLEDVLEPASRNIPEPQRRALDVALLRAESEGQAPLPQAVSLGVLGVLRALAGSDPVVIAVDDVQWLDRPTGSALEFVVRRLKGEAIAFVLARRGVEAEAPLGLDRALRDPVHRLTVGPPGGDALDRIVVDRLGVVLGAPTLRQIEAASGGNPYFAVELARSLAARKLPLGPAEPLPVPTSLRTLLGERLAHLDPPAQEAVLTTAALGRPTVSLVEASMRSPDAAAALEGAARAAVLEVDGERVRFTHPLIASVVYADAPAEQRRAVHARIAEVVEDPEERARHLALASEGPDASVALSLDEAARSVRARGAPGDAARLFEEARRLTPPELVDDSARRAVDAAEAHFEGGDSTRVRPLLEEAIGAESSERARALAFLGWVRGYQEGFPVGAEAFRTALEVVGPQLERRIEIERGLAWSLHELGNLSEAEIHVRAALDLAEQLGDPRVLARALADLAFHEAVGGRGDPLARIESALAVNEPGDWQTVVSQPAWIHGMILYWRGDLESAESAFKEMYRAAVDRGDEHSIPYMLFYVARTELLTGKFASASDHAHRAYEAAVETGQESERPFSLTIRALVDAHLGRVDSARAATDEGMSLARRLGVLPASLELRAARGFLELSLGNHKEAHAYLAPLRDEATRAGFLEPSLFRFHGDLIETLVSLGEIEDAASLVDELEQRADALEHTWARAVAARGRGLLAAATGDFTSAFAELEHSIELQEHLGQPLELARTYLVLGATRRRNREKRRARESIQSALDTFEALGAPLWAERARAELARIGGRAPAADTLTPTEQRVAELIAAGGTYREVADALFMSPKTVQWNLSKIYRKLGIRSRAQLAAALRKPGNGESTPAEPPVPPPA